MSFEGIPIHSNHIGQVLLQRRGGSLVVYCPNGIATTNWPSLEAELERLLDAQGISKGTYGVVADDYQIQPESIRDNVTNVQVRKRLACVWGVLRNRAQNLVFGCHMIMKVKSTPYFEAACVEGLAAGMVGSFERKRYDSRIMEFFMNNPVFSPIMWMSIYHPQKAIEKARAKAGF